MSTANIMLIESSRASAPSFTSALDKKGFDVSVFHKLERALASSDRKIPDLVVLDAASMRTSGTRLCRRARAKLDGVPIILVSPAGARPDPGSGASLTLVQPFTARKLINRVVRLLPGDESYNLEVGSITLNMANFVVECLDKKSRLTPKQAQLLEAFLQNPGKLMTRKRLIRQVWHTDYTGDTRTLDVHMSWLRKAIEPDPKNPRFLKTIRGMGYRLDVAAD
jgi:DNA-binding response OmpR family regulator